VNKLDAFILVGLLAGAMWGWATGVAVQFFGATGTILGFWSGTLIAPLLTRLVTGATTKILVTVATLVLLTGILSTLGRRVGASAAKALHRWRLGRLERATGAVVAIGIGLLGFWLVAVSLAATPNVSLAKLIQGSAIVRRMDNAMPPVPVLTARFSQVFDPAGFPRVFAGIEPGFTAPVTDPTTAEIDGIARLAKASTVKIEGTACGSTFDGSGFIAAPDLVITNAHVVAGVRSPTVLDSAGRHPARVMLFDPNVDIAILRVSGLAGRTLPMANHDVERSVTGAVLGFPGGGPFTVGGAAVRSTLPAVGRDIYGRNLITRNIFELQAKIRPGNSGGPFVLASGEVAGVVFARSVSDGGVGYALARSEVAPLLQRAKDQTTVVTTGPCITE
jgi:S1-C subfamily serine protease